MVLVQRGDRIDVGPGLGEPADLVQRRQCDVAPERPILDALGRRRAGELLPSCAPLDGFFVGAVAQLGDEPSEDGRQLRLARRRLRQGERQRRCALAVGEVRAVAPEMHAELGDRCFDTVTIGLEAVGGDPGHALEIRPQPGLQHLPSSIQLPVVERPAVTGLGDPAPAQQVPATGVEQGVLQDRGVLVSRRAVHRPRLGQPLTGGEDLLDQQPAVVADEPAQSLEIGERVGEAVDVVDAHAGERLVIGEQSRHRVDGRYDVGVLDAHGDEIVDGEEAAHVAVGLLPVLQAVVLTIDRLGRRQLGGALGEREPLLAEAQLAVDDLQRVDGVGERSPEHGQDDLAVRGVPVDVEPARRVTLRAVTEHRPPRRVELGPPDGDVVRHVVDDHTHPPCGGSVEERRQAVEASELLADAGVVDDVIAVCAARHRLGHRGEIGVAHAQRAEPVELGGGAVEPERRRQLEAVRRDSPHGQLGRLSLRGMGK